MIGQFDTDAQVEDKGYQAEGQYLYRQDRLNLVAGAALADLDADVDVLGTIDGLPVVEADDNGEVRHHRGYLYGSLNLPRPVQWTAALSYDDLEDGPIDVDELNPKLGVQWAITDDLLVRAAAFKTVKPALANNQTLEPTQVAGFNQFFDEGNGDVSTRYGIGLDHRLARGVFMGSEITWRDLDAQIIDTAADDAETVDHDEQTHRAYLHVTPTDRLALSAELILDRFEAEESVLTQEDTTPEDLETWSVPLGIRYFHPSGFFAGFTGTWVHQEVERDPANELGLEDGTDSFVVLDASVGYRLPRRIGIVSLEVDNLLDEGFHFQDDSFREFQDAPSIGPWIPERRILARLTLHW